MRNQGAALYERARVFLARCVQSVTEHNRSCFEHTLLARVCRGLLERLRAGQATAQRPGSWCQQQGAPNHARRSRGTPLQTSGFIRRHGSAIRPASATALPRKPTSLIVDACGPRARPPSPSLLLTRDAPKRFPFLWIREGACALACRQR